MRKERSFRKKICIGCSNEYLTNSNISNYCTKECRDLSIFKLESEKLIKSGLKDKDYVICQLCNHALINIGLGHFKRYHKEYNIQRYKEEFPNNKTQTDSLLLKKGEGGKTGGARMREDEHRKRLSEAYSGEKNPMHSSNTTDLFRKELSPFTSEFYKKKFSDLTDEECHRLAEIKKYSFEKKSHTQIRYWTERGMTEDEAKIKISSLQKTFSLEICIEKYGVGRGTERWKDRQEKWVKKVFNENTYIGGGKSIIGKNFNDKLENIIPEKYTLLSGNNEKFIRDKDRVFKYDLTIIDLKLIFEFNGDYWHCNPEKWTADQINKSKNKTAKEIWDYDLAKKNTAEKHGYKVIYIWESEYIKDPIGILQKCLEEINKERDKKNNT